MLGVDGVGAGGLFHPEFAACSAAFCASLSLPANIIPDRVPVKNVAIGTINSKNFWSIGEIALSGCVTKISEYNTTNTIPTKVNDKQTPIKNLRRAINCSSVYIRLSITYIPSLVKIVVVAVEPIYSGLLEVVQVLDLSVP
jgi:hypothetical protein